MPGPVWTLCKPRMCQYAPCVDSMWTQNVPGPVWTLCGPGRITSWIQVSENLIGGRCQQQSSDSPKSPLLWFPTTQECSPYMVAATCTYTQYTSANMELLQDFDPCGFIYIASYLYCYIFCKVYATDINIFTIPFSPYHFSMWKYILVSCTSTVLMLRGPIPCMIQYHHIFR